MNYIKRGFLFTFLSFIPLVNAQHTLTKNEAIEIALENNFGIRLANNNVEIARNNSGIFNTGMLPSLSALAGANYNLNNQEIETQDGMVSKVNDAETKSYNASINLNYTLFDGMGRRYNYKQLKETYQLSELQARETIENTYLQLFTVYFQIARLLENTNNLKQALEVSQDRFKRARYQYNYGQSTKLDLLNAQVDVNNDSINYINSNQQFISAKRDLNIILGVQENIDYLVETNIDFVPLANFEDLLAKANENNVILQQINKELLIGEYNIKANKGDYMPSIGVKGSYGWNKSDNPSTSFLASITSYGLNAGINMTWNVFDGGSTKTRVANARIALENQEILKEQELKTLENTLKNLWEEYNNQLFILEAQRQNMITSQDNFDRTEERHKLGQVTSIEFRQAQINLLNTSTSLNNAKYDAKLIELEILQLTGQLLDVAF